MPSPLFQFELRPLAEIQPWGAPQTPNLHWFGLTDGQYWIEAGRDKLFEYSNSAQARPGAPRYCDYLVARLYEDVIELAPHALDPVPDELRRYIALDESRPWNFYGRRWCDAIDADDSSAEEINLLDNAGGWIGRRTLDSGYLTPSTNVVFWSDRKSVHIEWDNRDKALDGGPAWTAVVGSWQLPRREFMDQVRNFHARLMERMAERVSQVAAGALATGIHVDIHYLRREQQVRSQSIEGKLGTPTPPTDWLAVSQSIGALEARR